MLKYIYGDKIENNNLDVNNTTKKNSSFSTILIVIAMLMLGFAAGYIYSKYSNDDKVTENNTQKTLEQSKVETKIKEYDKDSLTSWLDENSFIISGIRDFDSNAIDSYSRLLCSYMIFQNDEQKIKVYDSTITKPIQNKYYSLKEISKENTRKLLDYYFENVPSNVEISLDNCKSENVYYGLEDENNYYLDFQPTEIETYVHHLVSMYNLGNDEIEIEYKLLSCYDDMCLNGSYGTKTLVLTSDFKIVSIKTKYYK